MNSFDEVEWGIGMEDIRIPKADIDAAQDDEEDGKYYLGLTVKGRKRKDLASERYNQALTNQQATQIPIFGRPYAREQ